MSKTADDAAKTIKSFIPILENAKTRKINEADTRTIIHKFLSDVLGFDFITDITKEHAIRGTFADFAIMIDNEIKYFVEAKDVDTKLRDPHVRQVANYAIHKGVPWCVLTNGIVWRLYHIEFSQPVDVTPVFEIDLLALPHAESARLLWLLSKPSMKRGEINGFWEKRRSLNDANLVRALFSPLALKSLRRELRADTNVLIAIEDLAESLQGLLKESARDLIEEQGIKIPSKTRKRRKKKENSSPPTPSSEGATSASAAPSQDLAKS